MGWVGAEKEGRVRNEMDCWDIKLCLRQEGNALFKYHVKRIVLRRGDT